MAEAYDLVVIGGGPAGYAAAMRATQLGGRTAVVESTHFGGNCMNKACIPSKVLLAAARLTNQIRRAGRLAVNPCGGPASDPAINLDALQQRRALIVDSLRLGTEELLSDHGVEMVRGRGRLTARDTVDVEGRQLPAKAIVLATGSVSGRWPLEGAELPGVIGTEDVMELRQAPARVALLVNRPYYLELAQYFQALGSQVTLIPGEEGLLPEADHEITGRMGKYLHDSGMTIKRKAATSAIHQTAAGALAVELDNEGETLEVDLVLAARRFPNSSGLGLRELGVKMVAGAVVVDRHMATSVPGIYAAGDITVGPMWSHKANSEGIIAAENAMGRPARIDYSAVLVSLYTWPEIAWVGLTEAQAEAQGLEVSIGKVPMAINPFAMILDEPAGMIKIVADRKYGKILGVHMMGVGAMDLINCAAVAMLAEATVHELMRLVPKHPSAGEALVDACMDVEKRSIHMPKW